MKRLVSLDYNGIDKHTFNLCKSLKVLKNLQKVNLSCHKINKKSLLSFVEVLIRNNNHLEVLDLPTNKISSLMVLRLLNMKYHHSLTIKFENVILYYSVDEKKIQIKFLDEMKIDYYTPILTCLSEIEKLDLFDDLENDDDLINLKDILPKCKNLRDFSSSEILNLIRINVMFYVNLYLL